MLLKINLLQKKLILKKEIYKNLKLIYKKFLSLKNFNQNNKNDENFEKSKLNSNDNINDELYDTFHNKSLPIILKNIDRSSMANSVEVRSPYLDWRIVVFLFSISSKSKIKNGYNKYLLRHAGKDILVNDIRLRKKSRLAESNESYLSKKFKNFSRCFK